MERLTDYHVGENGAYMKCSGNCRGGLCENCEELEKIIDRLAAYEDTEIEPKEIVSVQEEPWCVFYTNTHCNLDGDYCQGKWECQMRLSQEDSVRLMKLAQAEKEEHE